MRCNHCGTTLAKGKKYPYCRKAECIRAEKYRKTTCLKCGKEFWKRNWGKSANNKRDFCSRDCAGMDGGGMVPVKCAACGKPFDKVRAQLTESNFCSRECRAAKRSCIVCGKSASWRPRPGNQKHKGRQWSSTCGSDECKAVVHARMLEASKPIRLAKLQEQDAAYGGTEWRRAIQSAISRWKQRNKKPSDAWELKIASAMKAIELRHPSRPARVEVVPTALRDAIDGAIDRARSKAKRRSVTEWDKKIYNTIGNLRKKRHAKARKEEARR